MVKIQMEEKSMDRPLITLNFGWWFYFYYWGRVCPPARMT
jgi:hypothetical protein